MINCNDWAPRNSRYEWPITDQLIANRNNLYYNFHTYNAGGVAWAYYRLSWFTRNYHFLYADD